ncbi:MAG: endonuclease [Deltaproteobacteria bacterium]|nr:endonuclease [Deltaproteobacteria bacterium]
MRKATRWSLLAPTAIVVLGLAACSPEPQDVAPDAGPVFVDAGEVAAWDASLAGRDAHEPSLDVGASGADASIPADGSLEASDAAVEGVDGSLESADATAAPQPDAAAPTPEDASAPLGPDAGAEGDAGPLPYANLDGLGEAALWTALYDLVKGHAALDYDDGSKVAMCGAQGFDLVNGKVECIYSGQQFDPEQIDVEGGFNMEHSWPKSDGAGSMPAESDMHHLFPSERGINNARSSYPFGDTSCTTSCNASAGGSKLGPIVGGTMLVFQVRPERQGDIARAHFYFALRYQMHIPSSEEAPLRRWNLADPPDDRERARNLAIEGYQGKRNPFVERPDFVDRISDF